MKALVFEKSGLENLQVKDVDSPSVGLNDVLLRVKMAGVNPIDLRVATSMPNVKPMPHIPGAEFAGVVEEVGKEVSTLRKGDRVSVYNRLFDGSCDPCLSGSEMLCEKGGIMGSVTNGGYTEFIAVPERNTFRIPDDLSWEMAASLPVAALTPYHALIRAGLGPNETLIVFGASGNTGSFAVQFGKRFGARVIAVSGKPWIKDFGADYVVGHDDVLEKVRDMTSGRMADVVLNSIGRETWSSSVEALGLNGRLAFFGTLTGGDVTLPLNRLYSRQAQIIGATGGTRKELKDLISFSKSLKLRVWKRFRLEEGAEALRLLSSQERDGRMLIELG